MCLERLTCWIVNFKSCILIFIGKPLKSNIEVFPLAFLDDTFVIDAFHSKFFMSNYIMKTYLWLLLILKVEWDPMYKGDEDHIQEIYHIATAHMIHWCQTYVKNSWLCHEIVWRMGFNIVDATNFQNTMIKICPNIYILSC